MAPCDHKSMCPPFIRARILYRNRVTLQQQPLGFLLSSRLGAFGQDGVFPLFLYGLRQPKWEKSAKNHIAGVPNSERGGYPFLVETKLQSDILLSLKALEDDDPSLAKAHLGNALSLLKSSLPENSWVGLYLYDGHRLILGPFQGTPACEVIQLGKGVVGTCFQKGETIFVKDVSAFPGYICCDAAAASEICVPIRKQGNIIAILDIDRPDHHDFENEVPTYEQIAEILANWA